MAEMRQASAVRRVVLTAVGICMTAILGGVAILQGISRAQPSPVAVPLRAGTVFPLRVNGPETIQHLRTGLADVLSARLAGSGEWRPVAPTDLGMTQAAAALPPSDAEIPSLLARASKSGVLYAITGALTQTAGNYGLEVRVWDARSGSEAFSRSVQGGSLEELLGKMDGLSKAILEGISASAVAGPEAAVLPPGPAPSWKEVVAAPTPVPEASAIKAEPTAAASTTTPSAPVWTTEPSTASSTVWRSQTLPFEAVDIAVGDVDGDGRAEIVIAERSAVHVYRSNGGELVESARSKARLVESFYSVDLFDADGDGVQEIAVSAMLHMRFRSFLLSPRGGGDGTRTVQEIPYLLRALRLPGRGKAILAGQSLGPTGKIYGPIYPLVIEGGRWREEAPLDLKGELCLSSLYYGDIDGDGRNEVVDVDLGAHLVVYREGRLVWRSEDLYGGFDNFFLRRAVTPEAGEEEMRIQIYDRILPAGKADGFPAERLIVTRNLSPYGNFLRNVSVGKRNELTALAWNGTGLFATDNPFQYLSDEHGSVVLANLGIADYDADGQDELVVAAVTTSPIPFAGSNTVVYAFKKWK